MRSGEIFGGRRWLGALFLVFALVGTACAGDTTDTGAQDGDGDGALPGEGKDPVEIGWITWDEDVAVTFLWQEILEEQGYEVNLTQGDVAPIYSGVAEGDLDVFLDAWLPQTHADYWEQFGDQLEDLGTWYDQGTLNIAVPEYVEDIETIGDLAGNAEMFGGEIIGIEPGAGLMRTTREEAIPTYGLEDYRLVEGSTPAMLAELERATSDEEPIVVTLWHPHWAYSAYPIKDLEDPEGAMGDAEELKTVAREGFTEDFPTLAEWFGNFEMPDDALASLEELVINEYDDGEESEAVQEWLSDQENRDLVDSWIS